MTFYLIGSRGRLGQAITLEYAESGIVSLDRTIYKDWSQSGASDQISRYFDKPENEGATLFVTSGLLDPKLSEEDLLTVNYHLPKNLIDAVTKLGIKVITFGTVMEGFLKSKNPYIQSKTALGEYVRAVSNAKRQAIHLQIHTLYGLGQPSPFMFLGQMLTAIREDVPFQMTSGRQLREYHHLTDEAKAIRQIENSMSHGLLNLSHGRPISLKTIAEHVFQSFGKEELLCLGALPEPHEENYENVLTVTEILRQVPFKDSLPAVVRYMHECQQSQEAQA